MTVTESATETFRSINPATEEVTAEYPAMSEAQLEATLAQAENAFQANRRQPIAWRSERMLALAQGLRRDRESLAHLVTAEMGKPLSEAQTEVDKCAVSCEYFARQAERFLADEPSPSDSPRSLVAFRPLGVVLAIMPWNYPLWQVLRFAAPALMAGNSAVLKHAPNCFGTALALERLIAEAGFPEGALGALLTGVEPMERVIADPRVRAVTLTGSDVAGSKVAEIAGREIKKAVLELGGSDFFLVLEDADLDQAAEAGVRSRFQNAGQTCIAAKRFLVAEPVADAFLDRFIKLAAQISVGDPLDPATRLGPLARQDLREKLHQQVSRSVGQGAQLALGGELRAGVGFFYSPTVLIGVQPGMAAFDEETFGPVAAFTRFTSEAEGLRLANHSRYGLGGNLWTGDVERGVRLAAELDTGGVFVNGMTHSDARVPFGGVKRSGYGRELHHFGIREFTNIQTVWQP
ncbi:MAG TPA: NAD-dependent succinate-semialdehyde dehydrogenase [Candidatus Dormibacteraeota bacterium]|nr:NAD-dependent succinate-semialdehyde dehydrogenase [Candidatus Dormibacteraeota bacterium]